MPSMFEDVEAEAGRAHEGLVNPLQNLLKPFKPKGYDILGESFQDPRAAANKAMLDQLRAQYGGRAAPDLAANQQFRTGQADLISALQAQAAGQGPSLAQGQLQQATDRNLAQAAALQASQRGVSPALAQRQIGMQRAQIGQEAAQQSALTRMQEQLSAREQLAGVLTGARGMDVQEAMAQQQAALQQQQLNDQLVQQFVAQGLSIDAAQFQAAQQLEALRVQEALGQQGIALQGQTGMLGAITGGLGAGAAAYAASDERGKNAIGPGEQASQQFLDALKPQVFNYRNPQAPGAAPGQQLGVMAQDIQNAPGGQQMVQNTPAGLMLDPAKGFGAVLAAQGQLNERLKRLEQLKGGTGAMTTERLPVEAGGTPETRDEMLKRSKESFPGVKFNEGDRYSRGARAMLETARAGAAQPQPAPTPTPGPTPTPTPPPNARDTRYQRNKGTWPWQTRETASSSGTGG